MFSRVNKVIYFEPAYSISYLLRKPASLWKKVLGISRSKQKIGENLFVFRSPPILPFGSRSHIVNCINQFLILLLIKIFIKDFKEKDNLCLWISDAIHYPLIKWLRPKISVYDCTDAIIFQRFKEQNFHDELRHRTIRDSSVSFFTSQLYFKEGRKYSDNCHYVPNGVDIKNFKKKYYRVPREMRNIKKPILGFVGTLDWRIIDRNIIKEILTKKPRVSLVFIGPIMDNFSKFKNEHNVFLLGKKDHREIPDFINKFDIALIPYRLTENMKFVYPVKLHEYLILGKPVVSTNLPEVMQFSDVIYIARNQREFVEKIDEALEEKDGSRKKERIETALTNTWDHRLEKIGSELEKAMKRCSERGFREKKNETIL